MNFTPEGATHPTIQKQPRTDSYPAHICRLKRQKPLNSVSSKAAFARFFQFIVCSRNSKGGNNET